MAITVNVRGSGLLVKSVLPDIKGHVALEINGEITPQEIKPEVVCYLGNGEIIRGPGIETILAVTPGMYYIKVLVAVNPDWFSKDRCLQVEEL
jgi:hypothetical protein